MGDVRDVTRPYALRVFGAGLRAKADAASDRAAACSVSRLGTRSPDVRCEGERRVVEREAGSARTGYAVLDVKVRE